VAERSVAVYVLVDDPEVRASATRARRIDGALEANPG
jgi:hypothetical protein